MSWVTIIQADVISEGFNPSEQSAIDRVQDATTGLTAILVSTINEARGWIEAVGNHLDVVDTVPASLKPHVIALARWRWLITCPKLLSLQTDARKDAAKVAQDILLDIAKGKIPIEAPEDDDDDDVPAAGNWNAEEKIAMRTHTADAN